MVDIKTRHSQRLISTKGDTLKAIPENLLQPIASIANRVVLYCPPGWCMLHIEAKRCVGVILVTATVTKESKKYPIHIGEEVRIDIQHLLNQNLLSTGKINLMHLSLVSNGEYSLNLE